VDRALTALLARTSDRTSLGAAGALAMAELTGARIIGEPGEPRDGTWEEDLRDNHWSIGEAGGQFDDALEGARVPVLFTSDCSVCITTLPTAMRHRPEARILWLDAHADFNTPQTSPSQFLGGMCLAAACGRWDAGFGLDPVDPTRIVMHGVRDVDGGELALLETAGVGRIEDPEAVVDALAAHAVVVHLDCDVLDPSVMPASFPAPGGLELDDLAELLDELALSGAELVGLEVTSIHPEHAVAIHEAIRPLLETSA
jgi:arginase family enzyme